MITISAWLAIDEATVENAGVQIVPGAHKQVIPHVKAPPEMLFRQMADPNYISTQPLSTWNSNRVSSFCSMNRHFTVRPPIPRIIVGSVWQSGSQFR
jgi:hypothetical protein